MKQKEGSYFEIKPLVAFLCFRLSLSFLVAGDSINWGIFTLTGRKVLVIQTLVNILLYDLYLKNLVVLFLDIN